MANARALDAALSQIAEEFTLKPPPEVIRLFPTWMWELPVVLRSQSAADLRASLRGLELQQSAQDSGSAVAYAFAKHALRAALEVYDGPYARSSPDMSSFATSGSSSGPAFSSGDFVTSTRTEVYDGVLFPRVCSSVATSGSSSADNHAFVTSTRAVQGLQAWGQSFNSQCDLSALVNEAVKRAPVLVRNTFSNFDVDLTALLSRPLPDLRAALARLETAHADSEIRRFTEDCLYPDTPASIEAAALGYTVLILSCADQRFTTHSWRLMSALANASDQIHPSTPHRRGSIVMTL